VCALGREVQVLEGPIAWSHVLEDPEQVPWCGRSGGSKADPNPNRGPKPVWSTNIQWEAEGGGKGDMEAGT